MSILSMKTSFAIVAAVVGVMSMSGAASAGPLLQKQCNHPIGCNPNTWTPGHNNHWNGGGGYGGGLSISFAAPVVADEGDCYYVRRQVFVPGIGVVSKRQMVCN